MILFLNSLEENMVKFTQSELNFVDGTDLLQNECDLLQIYDQPLIGVAAASDPLMGKIERTKCNWTYHLTPYEWLNGAICYFILFTLHRTYSQF